MTPPFSEVISCHVQYFKQVVPHLQGSRVVAIFAMRDIVIFNFIKYSARVRELNELTTEFAVVTSTPHEHDLSCQVSSWCHTAHKFHTFSQFADDRFSCHLKI